MNFETIIIMLLSYSLGLFTFWIKGRCENEGKSDLPENCPYINPKNSLPSNEK